MAYSRSGKHDRYQQAAIAAGGSDIMWPKILKRAAVLTGLFAMASTVAAADNSGIVIIDQQHRSTPFGSYTSQRRTEVYGPSGGFRYEEYQTPVQPVYPQYRNRHRGGYAYGPSYRGKGRVFEHNGAGGRYGAPAAPGVYGWGQTGDRNYRGDRHGRDDRRHRNYERSYNERREMGTGRAVQPAQRAVQPAERAIK